MRPRERPNTDGWTNDNHRVIGSEVNRTLADGSVGVIRLSARDGTAGVRSEGQVPGAVPGSDVGTRGGWGAILGGRQQAGGRDDTLGRVRHRCVDLLDALVMALESVRMADDVAQVVDEFRNCICMLHGPRPSSSQQRDLELGILSVHEGGPAVLVLTDDMILRAGIRQCLADVGLMCWALDPRFANGKQVNGWTHLLVGIEGSGRPDRFDLIEIVADLAREAPVPPSLIAVHHGELPSVVRLRLAEAGFTHAIPYGRFSRDLDGLSAELRRRDLPTEFALERPGMMRQLMGFDVRGALLPLLAAARDLPEDVWTSDRSLDRLPISRGAVRRLRVLARKAAGVPPPDFRRYSTSMRNAPEWPEWATVRELVRIGFGIRPPSS